MLARGLGIGAWGSGFIGLGLPRFWGLGFRRLGV